MTVTPSRIQAINDYYRTRNRELVSRLPTCETELARNTHPRTRDSMPERTALHYPSSTAPNQEPYRTTSPQEPVRRLPSPVREPVRESTSPVPLGDMEPPSYNSILIPSANTSYITSSIRTPVARASTRPVIHQPLTVPDNEHASNSGESCQPPPPDYEMTIQYRELYKVTESEPTTV